MHNGAHGLDLHTLGECEVNIGSLLEGLVEERVETIGLNTLVVGLEVLLEGRATGRKNVSRVASSGLRSTAASDGWKTSATLSDKSPYTPSTVAILELKDASKSAHENRANIPKRTVGTNSNDGLLDHLLVGRVLSRRRALCGGLGCGSGFGRHCGGGWVFFVGVGTGSEDVDGCAVEAKGRRVAVGVVVEGGLFFCGGLTGS